MNETALAVIDSAPLSAVAIRAQVNLIQEVMQAVMKEGTHFGTIPGTPKPSLWKPGAEKLLSTFRIAVDPRVEDLSTSDAIRYRVTAVARSMGSGIELGSAVGECSTDEKKYRWREAICQQEFDETPEDRRRVEWKKARNNSTYQVKQIRTNPADLANTVLKMAAKRAEVAVTLRVTAASDIFTQDIEDLPEELRPSETDALNGDGAPSAPKPQRASEAKKTEPPAQPPADPKRGPEEVVLVKDVREKVDGKGKIWSVDSADGRSFLTRYGKLSEDASAAKELEAPVRITYHVGSGGGFVLDSLEPVPDSEEKKPATPAAPSAA